MIRLEEASSQRVDMTWLEFLLHYNSARRGQVKSSTLAQLASAASHIPAEVLISDIDGAMLARLRDRLAREISPSTARSYVKFISAALNWAADQGMVSGRVEIPRDRSGRAASGARSRAITEAEYERILAECRSDDLRFAVQCLWHSGFRLSEIERLSWDPEADWWLDDSGSVPVVQIRDQKNGRVQSQPITPEFWRLVLRTRDRGGKVVRGYRPGNLGPAISAAGRRAGVLTDPVKRKYATSHDIGRRAFATRMAARLSSLDLKIWMRHSSIETTSRYYYQPQVEALASQFWAQVADSAAGLPGGSEG